MIIVFDNHCAAKPLDDLRIAFLLAVAMERIWDEDSWPGGKRNLGDGHRAGTRNHEIGSFKSIRDIIYERSNFRPERKAPVTGLHQLLIRLPSLMDDQRIYNMICTDLESFDDANIEPMGAA